MNAIRAVRAAWIVAVRVAVEMRGEVLEVRFEMALGVERGARVIQVRRTCPRNTMSQYAHA